MRIRINYIYAMGLIFYNTSIYLLQLMYRIASIFNSKAEAFIKGRNGLMQLIESTMQADTRHKIWFHCASLGEFEQGRPVIERIKNAYPSHSIILTFYSPSGYEIRKNYTGADHIFYLPIDSKRNAERFVKLVSPSIAFFVKYEFWHHYIDQLKRSDIPLISFSAIFRSSQLFFRPYGGFHRKILQRFEHIFVQNQRSIDLLSTIAINQKSIAGDTRFDRVSESSKRTTSLPLVSQFKSHSDLLVIGSSWEGDLEILIPYINDHAPKNLKFIIAPHEILESKIDAIQKRIKQDSVRYTQAIEAELPKAQVLIIDNIGMLLSVYQYADFAFVGGAYGKGLHNILEPAAYGIPIFFGNKKYSKFQEAIDLINLSCAFAIGTTQNLKTKLQTFEDESLLKKTKNDCLSYVKENLGATDKIMNHVKSILDERQSL